MRERPVTPQEQRQVIDLKISALKSELIGLTQQRDVLLGNPVARRMTVTIDTLPSPIPDKDPTDPLTMQAARRKHKLAEDIRSCNGCSHCLRGR